MRKLTDPLWKLQCRLNRRLPGSPRSRPARFVPRGASRDPFAPRTGEPVELSVVITTHARVGPCDALIEALDASLRDAGLHERVFVLVLEDPSGHDYRPVLDRLARCFGGRFAFCSAGEHLGKAGRCFGYQTAFDVVRNLQPQLTLFLEDDAILPATFVRSAIARWNEISDPDKAVLYLCRFEDDEVDGRWVRFTRQPLPGGRLQRTQWFDLHAFLVDRRFFELLDYTVFQPWPSRWQGEPSRSSGVSEQFTLRLFGRGNIYQVCDTLAYHGREPSVLNREARQARALDNHPSVARR